MSGHNGRDPMSGKLLPGHPHLGGGGASPVTKKMNELRRQLVEAVDGKTVVAIMNKMANDALEGDKAAAKIYLEFAVGKPHQYVEVSGLDGQSLTVPEIWSAIITVIGDNEENRVKIARAFHRLGQTRGPDNDGLVGRSQSDDGGLRADS